MVTDLASLDPNAAQPKYVNGDTWRTFEVYQMHAEQAIWEQHAMACAIVCSVTAVIGLSIGVFLDGWLNTLNATVRLK